MSMPQYIFLRHGKLDLPYADHSEMPFSVFADLGTGVLNPPVNAKHADQRIEQIKQLAGISGTQFIMASPAERCQETANILNSTLRGMSGTLPHETSALLSEVKFDLRSLNTGGEIERALEVQDITRVNDAIFTAMISGKYCEPIEHIYNRVQSLFERLGNNELKPCLCITHDFLMRVIEIYIRRNGIVFESISLSELQRTRRNTYLSGFATDQDLKTFLEI